MTVYLSCPNGQVFRAQNEQLRVRHAGLAIYGLRAQKGETEGDEVMEKLWWDIQGRMIKVGNLLKGGQFLPFQPET